jgi:uncharacterized membrane protein (DUF2068 family)
MSTIQTSRSRKLLRAIAIILTIYALIEIIDCLTLLLMHFGLFENPYPAMAFPEIDAIFNQQPIMFFPVFLYFASLRLISAVGMFRERMWAFWTTVLVCVTTILWVPFLMPLAGFELLLDAVILALLLVARFGKQPILSAN